MVGCRRRARSRSSDTASEGEDPNHDSQIAHLLAPRPQPDARHTNTVNFKIQTGNYEWNVHEEPLTSKSGFFAALTSSNFREATEHAVNLPEDEPELLARMILWCYFDEYPLSPIQAVEFGALTVAQSMEKARINDRDKPFSPPTDAQYDAVLHVKMYVLAEKFDMGGLQKKALAKCVAALKYEPVGFWPCVDLLDEMPEHVAEQLEEKLAGTQAGMIVSVNCERFKRLEEERPEIAAKIRAVGRVLLEQPRWLYRLEEVPGAKGDGWHWSVSGRG